MTPFLMRPHLALILPATLFLVGFSPMKAHAQAKLYNPIDLPLNKEITDTLSEKDIPTGQGGFAKDYIIDLDAGDQVAIDLSSSSFDAIVSLLAEDGSTVAENDDGPDGSTNALLFSRITKSGTYVIRVRAFGETGIGNFKLKVTRLRPI